MKQYTNTSALCSIRSSIGRSVQMYTLPNPLSDHRNCDFFITYTAVSADLIVTLAGLGFFKSLLSFSNYGIFNYIWLFLYFIEHIHDKLWYILWGGSFCLMFDEISAALFRVAPIFLDARANDLSSDFFHFLNHINFRVLLYYNFFLDFKYCLRVTYCWLVKDLVRS